MASGQRTDGTSHKETAFCVWMQRIGLYEASLFVRGFKRFQVLIFRCSLRERMYRLHSTIAAVGTL